jgi:uncharacterized protein
VEVSTTTVRKTPSLPEVERRSVGIVQAEFRESSDKMIFEGRAAVFDEWARIGDFSETIKRGAFRRAIDRGIDTVFALNHNYDFTMARTSVSEGPGMLQLEESNRGLETYAELAPTSAARDLKVLVESRVISQMSFAWPRGATTDEWNDDYTERSITEFTDLIDVSPVVHPAYAGTQASMRDYMSALAERIRRVAPAEEEQRLIALLELALSDRSEELDVLADSQERDVVAEEPVAETEEVDDPEGQPWRLAARRRRLQLMSLGSEELADVRRHLAPGAASRGAR